MMWRQLFFVWGLIMSAAAIKVPVDEQNVNDNSTSKVDAPNKDDQPPSKPVYYAPDNGAVDSYLIPPDPHKPDEDPTDLEAPATYLLPPPADKQTDFYASSSQSDWYPISQTLPKNQPANLQVQPEPAPIPIFIANEDETDSTDGVKRYGKNNREFLPISIPSRLLEPPLQNARNDYKVSIPSKDLELPIEEISRQYNVPPPIGLQLPYVKLNQKYNPILIKDVPVNFRLKSIDTGIPLHLLPPKPELSKYKNPTKLYPKKFTGSFKPVPIPVSHFAERPIVVSQAKPLKPYDQSGELEYVIPIEDKKIYLYEQAQKKRNLKQESKKHQPQDASIEQSYEAIADAQPGEPDASETNYQYPGRNAYPAPLRQAPPTPSSQHDSHAPPAQGERTEFRMHGMKGPHSYQFGYDTGKGKNRQFRYEERDNDGHVKGHYGYVDRHGKLRVVNYDAHPELGFRAEAPTEEETQ